MNQANWPIVWLNMVWWNQANWPFDGQSSPETMLFLTCGWPSSALLHLAKARWMVYFMGNPMTKWMMTGETPMTSETTILTAMEIQSSMMVNGHHFHTYHYGDTIVNGLCPCSSWDLSKDWIGCRHTLTWLTRILHVCPALMAQVSRWTVELTPT